MRSPTLYRFSIGTFLACAISIMLPARVSAGSCCETAATPGCNDFAVETCVCSQYDFCCMVQWDSTCVAIVELFNCGSCAASGGEVCVGYPAEASGTGTCCLEEDPCGLADNGVCECLGRCSWDYQDCLCNGLPCTWNQYCSQTLECAPCSTACEGRICGPHPCGGSCGECHDGYTCTPGGTCDPLPLCVPQATITCGQDVQGQLASGNSIIDAGCTSSGLDGAEEVYLFTPGSADVFTVKLNAPAGVFVSLFEGLCEPRQCLGGASANSTLTWVGRANVPYFIVVDAAAATSANYTLSLRCRSQCTPNCTGRICGFDGCTGSCGTCPLGFSCNALGDCLPSTPCTLPATPLSCGQTVSADSSIGVNRVSEYLCSDTPEPGKEILYSFTPALDTSVRFQINAKPKFLNLFMFNDPCHQERCSLFGNTTITTSVKAGQTYYLAVDGPYGQQAAYSLSVACDVDCTKSCNGVACCAEAVCGIDGVCGSDDKCGYSDPPGVDGKWGVCGVCPDGEVCSAVGTCGLPSQCAVIDEVHCGDSIQGHNTGLYNIQERYICSSGTKAILEAPEMAYKFKSNESKWVHAHLSHDSGHKFSIVLASEQCTMLHCIDVFEDSVLFRVEANQQYYFIVDGKTEDSGKSGVGNFVFSVNCAVDCIPDCDGRVCGSDGCGGSCGECDMGSCQDGFCVAPEGCQPHFGTGCAGCSCEPCVCALDAFCCEAYWDTLCAEMCAYACGGCGIVCGDGVCSPGESCTNCPSDCSCQGGSVCLLGTCCQPSCPSKSCGSDGCGGICGVCPTGVPCVGGVCLSENNGCWVWSKKGCSGCACEPCVCSVLPECCADAWTSECALLCDGACGGCGQGTCGDGQCERSQGERCSTCPSDCACDHGVCWSGECCVPDCTGRSCGSDGCGGVCGSCESGICAGGSCLDGQGCNISPTGGCDGCLCEACVCLLMPECCTVAWNADCALQCAALCGGCDSGGGTCGDMICEPQVGEYCLHCPSDCACSPGNICLSTGCSPDYCGAGLTKIGCCQGDVLFACAEDILQSVDCSLLGLQCGWSQLSAHSGAYLCGMAGSLAPSGDPTGQYPPTCPALCSPQCDGIQCGDDGCGGECGHCPPTHLCQEGSCFPNVCGSTLCTEGQVCVSDTCCSPNCQGKFCGGDGCGGNCGQCPEGKSCLDGACCSKPCLNVCCKGLEVCFAGSCCTPNCLGKGCGGDGCGGTCGTCPGGFACSASGACVCVPDCEDKVCGDDGCGGQCGSCDGLCELGLCLCQPSCMGRECGPDGCNGECGTCPPEQPACDLAGLCTSACEPDCQGRECGPDGCGTLCGQCEEGLVCKAGLCEVPCAPECDSKECGPDGCGAYCGTCPAAAPLCVEGVCEVAACTPQCSGKACGPDGCGGDCGSCPPETNCESGVCQPICTPSCTGKECGPDGCGGLCGNCPKAAPICELGACRSLCAPQCAGKECGPDGCGGLCGECQDPDWECLEGTCTPPDAPDSHDVANETPEKTAPKGESCSATPVQAGGAGALALFLATLLLLAALRLSVKASSTTTLAALFALLLLGCTTPPTAVDDTGHNQPQDIARQEARAEDQRIIPDSVTEDSPDKDQVEQHSTPDLLADVPPETGPCFQGCPTERPICIYPTTESASWKEACSKPCASGETGKECTALLGQPGCCSFAQDAAGQVGIYCVPSESACVPCGDFYCPIATHQCIPEVGECGPITSHWCDGVWCGDGQVCSAPGVCCPISSPVPCGLTCCQTSQICLPDESMCLCAGCSWCDGMVCPPGHSCKSGMCCPDVSPIPCGDVCCAAGTTCDPACGVCLFPGQTVCQDCSVCQPGTQCTNMGGCMPLGASDCASGQPQDFCSIGQACVSSPPWCCPSDKPQVCSGTCCGQFDQCVHDSTVSTNGVCLCNGCSWCGDGFWCPANDVCLSYCLAQDASKNPHACCVPLGAEDCMDGTWCGPGQVCVGYGQGCCPAAAPQLCGDECCPASFVCVDYGEACVPIGTTICDDGSTCDPGMACMESAHKCMPLGSKDCGNGEYCEPGTSCNFNGTKRCCPNDATQGCGDVCCPASDLCIPETSTCVPIGWTYCEDGLLCGPGLTCMESAHVCFPQGAQDCGNGTYCSLGYACTPSLSAPVDSSLEAGCNTSAQPGCSGCACEACVCAISPYCCDTQWDSVCVSLCTNFCGSPCADVCLPDCVGRQCGPDGCGGLCGSCPPGQMCGDGKCLRTNSGCVATLQAGCQNCDCQECVCGAMPQCCSAMGWWGGGWSLECVAACETCGGCSSCTPSCQGRVCGPDGCGGSCGQCLGGLVCNLTSGTCGVCIPNCTDKACGDDGCGGSCGSCQPGYSCKFGSCDVALSGNGKCCPLAAPLGCNKTCCPAADTCIPNDGDGLCLPPGAEYCGLGTFCFSGEQCMTGCDNCKPDGAEECGPCNWCPVGTTCADPDRSMCCPVYSPVACGDICCQTADTCYPHGGWTGKGLCVPPLAEACHNGEFYCESGLTCRTSCDYCMPDGSCDLGDCEYCGPGFDCYPNGGLDGKGLCIPDGALVCDNGKFFCLDGKKCMTSCAKCMPPGACDLGNCKYCFAGSTCYPTGGYNGTGLCVPVGHPVCNNATYYCSDKTYKCMANCNHCRPPDSQDCGNCLYCPSGKHCCENNTQCCWN